MSGLSTLREAVLLGNAKAAISAAQAALDGGVTPLDLIDEGIRPAMSDVGQRFEDGEYFVPELLMAARATKQVFELIRPLLATAGAKPQGRVVLGTVRGDQHDIGKNLVAAMLEGSGFEVIDLGVDVAPQKFVQAVEQNDVDLVGFSSLLTTTLPGVSEALGALGQAGVRNRVKVMVGGAPVTESFASSVGADGYAENAAAAVQVAKRLMASHSGGGE
jgi:5-methyltetrahydrofolate--homocysteine methyltransferase